ncbi:MAG: hypothetical protein NZ959_12030, partial [Armatimonadetes bacterium]|nr:hypothetical protein [Armatimonadota bacterium]MDW8121243.1 hypothetical protein [Armatimonadota bacterium]
MKLVRLRIGKKKVLLVLALCLSGISLGHEQTAPLPEPVVTPSYLPAIGKTYRYRLSLSGTMTARWTGHETVAHLAGQVELEQKWKKEGNRLRCDLTIRGGSLRMFQPPHSQTMTVGRSSLTFWTNQQGQILDVRGSGVRSLDELIANFDLLATGIVALLVPFPEKGIIPGDSWQGAHRLGPELTMLLLQCTDRTWTTMGPVLKLRIRSVVPMDLLVDPALRQLLDLKVRYEAEAEVTFQVLSARTQSASGTIKVQMGFKVPSFVINPPQSQEQNQRQGPTESHQEGSPAPESQSQSETPSPSQPDPQNQPPPNTPRSPFPEP